MVRAAGPIGLILNIGWLIFGGIATAILWLLGALALAATIIGIPFAIQALKLAKLSLAPFGTVAVPPETVSVYRVFWNIIWVLLIGWIIALVHLVIGIICMLTICLIPFGLQHFRLIVYALSPFGRTVIVKD